MTTPDATPAAHPLTAALAALQLARTERAAALEAAREAVQGAAHELSQLCAPDRTPTREDWYQDCDDEGGCCRTLLPGELAGGWALVYHSPESRLATGWWVRAPNGTLVEAPTATAATLRAFGEAYPRLLAQALAAARESAAALAALPAQLEAADAGTAAPSPAEELAGALARVTALEGDRDAARRLLEEARGEQSKLRLLLEEARAEAALANTELRKVGAAMAGARQLLDSVSPD